MDCLKRHFIDCKKHQISRTTVWFQVLSIDNRQVLALWNNQPLFNCAQLLIMEKFNIIFCIH